MGDTGGKFRIAGAYYLPLRPAGHPGKAREIWLFKGYNPEEWSLYDLIKGRMAAARESGEANTSCKLLRWATEDEDRPRIPRAGEGFPRKIIARAGYEYTKRRKLVVSARRHP